MFEISLPGLTTLYVSVFFAGILIVVITAAAARRRQKPPRPPHRPLPSLCDDVSTRRSPHPLPPLRQPQRASVNQSPILITGNFWVA